MTSTDKIHDAQQQVATLQDRLDDVQRMLDKAERIAAAGEAAKKRAQQLLGVSIALVVVGILLLIWGGRNKAAS
jgi:3-keto-L-gulonate-6-phosphate decarboxylase